MHRDFENYWKWYQNNFPLSTVTKEEAIEAYNNHYSCNCESCRFRKEHGFIPIKLGKDDRCTAPLVQLGPIRG